MPGRLRLWAPVRDVLAAHLDAVSPFGACGLLLGRVDAGEVQVTRALPCPNVAEPEARTDRYRLDPGAVVNVTRTLRGTGERIVGFFHSRAGGAAGLEGPDRAALRLWPDTVWMAVGAGAGTGAALKAWWHDGGARPFVRELEILTDVTPRQARSACSETGEDDRRRMSTVPERTT